MKTRTITVYEFGELSESAKETAKQKHAAAIGYSWADEALESLKALAEHFGGKLADYSIDYFAASHSSATFRMTILTDSEIEEELAQLGEYNPETLRGLGDCKLTGVSFDEDAIDGFRIAHDQGETDLDNLMQAAFDSWLKAVQADCEGQYTDEAFAENCGANGYEFHANGELA